MNDGRAIILIRILVGWVFIVEGALKLLRPAELGAGRFAAIGIPAAGAMGPFVGVVELICGVLIVLGLATRWAAIPLLVDMGVAIASTKVPILLGHGYWHFVLPPLKHYGWLSMLHAARTDFSMVLGLLFLLIAGSGAWALDRPAWR